MNCDRCGSPNVAQKQIRSKKDGNMYTIYECKNGCTNGKFNYSFFPPKESKPQPQQSSGSEKIIELLKEQNALLAELCNRLGSKPMVHTKSELQPDDDWGK